MTCRTTSRLFAVLVFAAGSAVAESPKTPVSVSATTEDSIGSRLAFTIREGIRRSASMELVDEARYAFVRIHLVTLNPDASKGKELWTAYSIVWTRSFKKYPSFEQYLTQTVGTCGADRLEECGASIIARTDEQALEIRADEARAPDR